MKPKYLKESAENLKVNILKEISNLDTVEDMVNFQHIMKTTLRDIEQAMNSEIVDKCVADQVKLPIDLMNSKTRK